MNDRGHRSLHKFTDYGCLSGTSIAVSNNSQFIATGYEINLKVHSMTTPPLSLSISKGHIICKQLT